MMEWTKLRDTMSIDDREVILKDEVKKLPLYRKQFLETATQISFHLGQPTKGDGKLKKEEFKMMDIWKAQYHWNTPTWNADVKLIWIPSKGYRIYKIICKAWRNESGNTTGQKS